MSNLQPYIDPTGKMSAEQINAQNITAILQELNQGVDATDIQRRSIQPGQFRLLSYQPGPFSLNYNSSSVPIQVPAGGYSSLVLNFTNNGLTTLAGQTFLPVLYVDLFIDPPDTSSTANIYANSGNNVYPGGSNITSAMQNLTFSWYLRNSTPVATNSVVSYVFMIRNQDSANHYYWISTQVLLPADNNLNNGNTAVYLP